MFTCSNDASNSGMWLLVKGVSVVNCQFNHTSYGKGSGAPLSIKGECIFSNNHVINNSDNKDMFKIEGNNNIISNNIIVFIRMNDNTENNIFSNNTIIGDLSIPISKTTPYMENNIFKDNLPHHVITDNNPSTNINALYGCSLYVINNTSAYEISSIKYGYNGQILTLKSNTGGQTLKNNENIILKTGADKVFAINEVITIKNINNVWHEI